MATKTYDEYEVDQLVKAKTQSDAYSADRRAQADSAVAASNAVYDSANNTARKNYTAAAKETENSYRDLYDANAVSEIVARRNVEEAMANMGLTNSGLNATQQTAISLQRGSADYQTTQKKQSAVDAIMRELDSVIAQNNAEKMSAARGIYAQADADVLSFKNNADAAARQNAATLYKADQEATAAQYAAEQEAAAKQAQLLLDAQKAQSQERVDMYKLGYEYDSLTGEYKHVGAAEQQEQLTADRNKAIQMSSNGKPSYTSIEVNASMYAKTSKDEASKYIKTQYVKGYISEEQRNDLLAKYGKGGLTWAENQLNELDAQRKGNTLYVYGESGTSYPVYVNYANYVKEKIAEWTNAGLITPVEAKSLAIEKGVWSE